MNDQNFNQESYTPPVVEPISPQALRPRIDLRAAFGSGLFLALCIIMTIVTVTGSFSISINQGEFESSYSLNIIALLVTIGMWITFSAARSSESTFKKSGLTLVSGSLYAMRIVFWVSAVMLIVCAIIVVITGVALPSDILRDVADFNDIFDAEIAPIFAELLGADFVDVYLSGIDWATVIPLLFITLGIIFAIVGVVMMIFNVTYYKKLHLFAKSLCHCAEDPEADPKHARAVSIWLLVLGILSLSVVMIVGYVFVKKYFADPIQD